jgi:DNA-binding SARP family transcriptional activator
VPAAALAAHRGDLAALTREVEGARSELAAHGLTIETPVATCDLASICVGGGAPTLARSLAEEARADAAVLGIPWSEARAALLSAAASEGGAGDPLLSAALEITEREGLDGLWTRRERDLGVPLLGRAIAKGLGPPGVAERLLGSCGPRAVARVLEGSGAGDRKLRLRLAEIAGWVAGIDMELVDRLLRDRDAAVRAGARATWTRVKARPRAEISILTLGGLEVRRDGVRVPEDAFARSKARALLACLVAAGRPVHRDALCDALWPDLSPRRAGAALRTTLVDLRRAVEPEVDAGSRDALVATEGDVIRLAFSDRDFLDVAELTRLAGPARGEAVEESIRRLLRANDLVRGPFLPEWPYEDWAEATRAEVDRVALTVLEELARALASSGHPDLAIPHLRRLVALEPEREGHHRALMDAYDATGERAMALRQYHACRVVLRRELGVEPSSATRAAFLRLLGEQPLVELAV